MTAPYALRTAVEGCCHAQLSSIYAAVDRACRQTPSTLDVLFICGDFQGIRNADDLRSLACPEKYKEVGEFHRYYSGQANAPVLTVVIGGNHEASDAMSELYVALPLRLLLLLLRRLLALRPPPAGARGRCGYYYY